MSKVGGLIGGGFNSEKKKFSALQRVSKIQDKHRRKVLGRDFNVLL